MKFEWDDRKNAVNLQKHGISFERAARVFFDPYAVEGYDGKHSDTEERYSIVGIEGAGMVYVVFTEPDAETIRIISARKAAEKEVEEYYGSS